MFKLTFLYRRKVNKKCNHSSVQVEKSIGLQMSATQHYGVMVWLSSAVWCSNFFSQLFKAIYRKTNKWTHCSPQSWKTLLACVCVTLCVYVACVHHWICLALASNLENFALETLPMLDEFIVARFRSEAKDKEVWRFEVLS